MVKKVLTFCRGSASYIFAVPTSSSYSLAQIGEIVILILLYQICLLRSLTHCKKLCFSQPYALHNVIGYGNIDMIT